VAFVNAANDNKFVCSHDGKFIEKEGDQNQHKVQFNWPFHKLKK
jgi:hypothetical protein